MSAINRASYSRSRSCAACWTSEPEILKRLGPDTVKCQGHSFAGLKNSAVYIPFQRHPAGVTQLCLLLQGMEARALNIAKGAFEPDPNISDEPRDCYSLRVPFALKVLDKMVLLSLVKMRDLWACLLPPVPLLRCTMDAGPTPQKSL